MTEVPSTLTVLLIEMVIATSALCILVTVTGWNRWRRRRAVVVTLVKKLKSGGPDRLAKLQQLISENGAQDATAVNRLAENILRLETQLYQNLVGGLIEVTGKPLLSLDQQVESLINELTKALPTAPAPMPATQTTTVDLTPITEAVNDGIAKLARDNIELKEALLALRSDLQNLAMRPSGSGHPIASSLANAPAAIVEPLPNPIEPPGVDAPELDFAAAAPISDHLEPDSALPTALPETESLLIDATANESKPAAPTITEAPVQITTPAEPPNVASPDDGIASMPDDWLNQTETDTAKTTTPAAVSKPNSVQPEPTALDDVYTATDKQTLPEQEAIQKNEPLPVEIDPDAFLDSLLNEAKKQSLNVIAATAAPPSGKASGKPLPQTNADKSTKAPSNTKSDITTTKNKTHNTDKAQLETELEELLG